jgi:hypothetical protein
MIFGNGIYDTMVKRCDTIGHIQQKLFSDTLFPKIFSFGDTMTYQITYNLSVYKKSWKLNGSGKKSTLLLLYPYKHLIPVLSNFTINYDTIKGISYVARINASFDSNITGYRLIKTILNPQHAIVIIDTLPLLTLNTFFDTIYPNVIPFEETSGTELRYSIAAYNSKWQIYGDDVSRSTVVYSYKRFKPIANAGLDDMVDISSDVLLIGKVNSYTYRVTKMEWKIGENSWVEADSGKIFFSTNNDYHTENILCQFKVTDTMGNSTIDTTIITKKIQIKRLDNLPTYKASQIFLTKRLKTSDEFIMIAHKDVSTYSVWSTDDFTHFKVLIDDANINNDGQFFTFGGKYYFYNISQSNALKSYTSDDGCIWGDINPIITISNPIKWSQVLITENKCILTAKSVLRKAFRETILLL